MSKISYIGKDVNIDGKQGKIVQVLGMGYKIEFYNHNDGMCYVSSNDIHKYFNKKTKPLHNGTVFT